MVQVRLSPSPHLGRVRIVYRNSQRATLRNQSRLKAIAAPYGPKPHYRIEGTTYSGERALDWIAIFGQDELTICSMFIEEILF